MGKPTKPKQAQKSSAVNDGQSSIKNFFKKKSEMPSPLFTQVIPVAQKGIQSKDLKKQIVKPTKKSTTIETAKPVSAQSQDFWKNTVIPATPKSSTAAPEDFFNSSSDGLKKDFESSPLSQTIIPDTPDNVKPKKRPFTSLMKVGENNARTNSDSVADFHLREKKQDGLHELPSESCVSSEIQKRHPFSHKGNINSFPADLKDGVKNSKDSEREITDLKNKNGHTSFFEGDENILPRKSNSSKSCNRVSKLSRKGKKLAKNSAAKDCLKSVIDNFEKDKLKQIDTEALGTKDGKMVQALAKVQLKPSVCRVRSNPIKNNPSRLSLSRNLQKGIIGTTVSSTKRSPLRGNSPYAKRFMGATDDDGLADHGEGVERVKKSLLEQYGSSISQDSPDNDSKDSDIGSLCTNAHDDSWTSEKVTERTDNRLSDRSSTEFEVGKSLDKHKQKAGNAATTETSLLTCLGDLDNKSSPSLQKMAQADNRSYIEQESDEFITVIPDTCPETSDQNQEVLVIPDTCPSSTATPIESSVQSISEASGSHIQDDSNNFLKADTHTKANYEESRNNSTTNNDINRGASEPDLERTEHYVESGPEKASTCTAMLNTSAETPKQITNSLQEAGNSRTLEDITSGKPVECTQKDPEIKEVQNSMDTDGCAKLVPGTATEQDLKNPGPCVSSPGTAALWDAMDDSLLEGLDLDDFDLVEENPNNGNPVSALDKQFAQMSPFKKKPVEGNKQAPKPELRPADLCRFVVTGIKDQMYEKVLDVVSMTDQSKKTCILKDTWQQTLVDEGMVVAVHGSFDHSGSCVINGQQGYLVVIPDHLLTGTAVSNSIRCMRRSVLNETFKGLERGNRAMLLGSLLHEVFQQAIVKKHFQKQQLMQIARDVLMQPAFLCDMYSLKVDENNLLEEVEEYAETIKRWSDGFLGQTPRGRVDIKWPGAVKSEQCSMSVAKVTDIEETIWSPRWGVKGKVDLTVQVKIHRHSSGKPAQHIMPLELKTGRETNSVEHRSQLILYSLMLGDLQPSPDLGFLLYLKTAAMKSVPANHLDKRELVHLRNQLAYHLSRRATPLTPSEAESAPLPLPFAPPSLPEPIHDDFTCGRCAHLQSCSLLQRLEGSARGHAPTLQSFFSESINHLLDSHYQYFAHWYLLCALEHEASQKRNDSRNIWCKEANDRERDGLCLSSMELVSATPKDKQNGGFSLVFKKQGSNSSDQSSLDHCIMTQGDRVVVSVQGTRRVAMCVGFIEEKNASNIKISSDSQPKPGSRGESVYRIDKDDSYNSMAASMVNLDKLMRPEQARLRNIVIDKQAPTSIQKPSLPTRARKEVATIFKDLNEDQRAAIKAVLRSQDYTVIIGMPGTGKTTTIVALVRILVACEMSVLLTSYTHSAVDNILLKLTKHNIDFLRLGSQHSIHPQMRQYSDSRLMKKTQGVAQLATEMERKRVVATTSLGMKHALFSRHRFDVCIVDEASQISQPVCLGPLYSAERFVLVGDQCQLPPLIQSSRARELGMDESLFQRLVSAHDSSTIKLRLQFRMNAKIMALSNHLVYDGAMRCGSDAIAGATLHLPNWDEWIQNSNKAPWLMEALQTSTVVSFLNTDQISRSRDQTSKDNTNRLEASLVRSIIEGLIQCGCSAGQIGVISPYRRQCQLLTSTLADLGSKVKSLEVNTVDKYQGRDKDVIVVSFSHSQIEAKGGSILQDLRRLNVAITRAKHKLLLVGSMKVLSQFQPVRTLLTYLSEHNLVCNKLTMVSVEL